MPPLFIGPYEAGVQQNLKPFMIPEDAFPGMLNASVFRGRVERKSGYTLLGRLTRTFTATSIGNFSSATSTYNLFTLLSITETNAQLTPGFVITIGAPDSQTLTDNGTGILAVTAVTVNNIQSASVNYLTGVLTVVWGLGTAASAATFTGGYYPGLPVMGIRTREIPNQPIITQTVFFDTKYAYIFTAGFVSLSSTLAVGWDGADNQLFWSTNFQQDANNNYLFWATNDVPGLHSYLVTNVANISFGAGVSQADVTTATANNFQVGDNVSLVNMSAGLVVGPATSNGKSVFGKVKTAGNPFTMTVNSTAQVFAVSAATGIASDDQLINQNNAGQDGIRIYNGTTWQNFNPAINSLTVLTGGLMLIPYKGRMVVLRTWEGSNTEASVNFRQRARWSENGTAWFGGVAWRDDIVGHGGFVDAPTEEEIIAAGFVKDTLIVNFERSTWQLVYIGNEVLPFIWQRINAELGADATFSSVQFDNGLLVFGNVGVHHCNGVTVSRIDQAIPDEIFSVHNNVNGPTRTVGIRDFFLESVYFSYTNNETNVPSNQVMGKTYFPNQILVYNYRNNTFSFFDDNATAFGYYQRITDTPWSALTTFPWEAWQIPWGSGVLDAGFPNIAFGNQQGFVSLIDPIISSNDPTLMITGIATDTDPANVGGSVITSPQHNLFPVGGNSFGQGSYITISGALGVTNANGITFQVLKVIDANNFSIRPNIVAGVPHPITGTYTGGGVMTVLSNVIILTKEFTPFWIKGKRYDLKYINILFDKTTSGEMQVDIFIDFNDNISMTDTSTGNVLGSPIISTAPESNGLPYYSFQVQGEQIWKRFYTVAMGETFQVQLSFNDAEMRNPLINNSDVVVHAMMFFFEESGEFY